MAKPSIKTYIRMSGDEQKLGQGFGLAILVRLAS